MWVSNPMITVEGRACLVIIADGPCPGAASGSACRRPHGPGRAMPGPGRELVTTPKGKEGRPSRAMTLEQATAMLEHAKASRLHAYVVVSLLTGIRTEEARALRWSH